MQAKQFKTLFLSLTLLVSATAANIHATSVTPFTYNGKQYHARAGTHEGQKSLLITDEVGDKTVLVQQGGRWQQYQAPSFSAMGKAVLGIPFRFLNTVQLGMFLFMAVTAAQAGLNKGQLGYNFRYLFADQLDKNITELQYLLYRISGKGINPFPRRRR